MGEGGGVVGKKKKKGEVGEDEVGQNGGRKTKRQVRLKSRRQGQEGGRQTRR